MMSSVLLRVYVSGAAVVFVMHLIAIASASPKDRAEYGDPRMLAAMCMVTMLWFLTLPVLLVRWLRSRHDG